MIAHTLEGTYAGILGKSTVQKSKDVFDGLPDERLSW